MLINSVKLINFRAERYLSIPVKSEKKTEMHSVGMNETYLDNLSRINATAVIKPDNQIKQNKNYKNNLRSMIQNNQSVMMAIIPRTFTAEDLNGDDKITLTNNTEDEAKLYVVRTADTNANVALNGHWLVSLADLDEEQKDKLCKAALGLTLQEAESAFALAMVNDGKISIDDLDVILQEKVQVIKKTGILEFINTTVNIDDVGGLENMKK